MATTALTSLAADGTRVICVVSPTIARRIRLLLDSGRCPSELVHARPRNSFPLQTGCKKPDRSVEDLLRIVFSWFDYQNLVVETEIAEQTTRRSQVLTRCQCADSAEAKATEPGHHSL